MAKRARVLEAPHVARLLSSVSDSQHTERNRVAILLSYKAGLRAAEIAGLLWTMVLRADGRLGDQLQISSGIAKNGRARTIPLNPELSRALRRLHREQGRPLAGPVVRSARGGHMTPRSVVNWFAALYRSVGYDGCSSHSGRRTFITRTARLLAKTGGSLRDVQELAGHRALTTTEAYIEGDRQVQRRLVRLI